MLKITSAKYAETGYSAINECNECNVIAELFVEVCIIPSMKIRIGRIFMLSLNKRMYYEQIILIKLWILIASLH